MRVSLASGRIPALLLFVVLLATGCAHAASGVTAADVPRLEEAVRAAPADTDLRTRLGIAHFEAGSFDAARTTLLRAVAEGATDGAAFLYLGLAHEEMGDWSGARQAYARYVDVGRFDRTRGDLRGRLALVIRKEIEADARDALAREEELTAAAPTPRTLAVFPFRMIIEDPDLAPLGHAFVDMLTTDLSIAGAVQLLERARVQNLLREMALSEAGYTAPESGARAGRMLRAEHVVQGALTVLGADGLRFDADVVQTTSASPAGTLTEESPLARLFDLEKEIVFGILDVLGVELTPTERAAINERWTENLFAFLLYGQGIQARDEGRFADAADFFARARQADPSFSQAQVQEEEMAAIQQAETMTPQQFGLQTDDAVEVAAREAREVREVLAAEQALRDVIAAESRVDDLLRGTLNEVSPNPTLGLVDLGSPDGRSDRLPETRNATQEVTGSEGVSSGSTFTVILRILRPGGN